MLITKADGTQEEFEVYKLRTSLRKAGARKKEIDEIVREIESFIFEGITTQKIYKKAFDLLAHFEKPVAAKYSLRRAVFGLGPTGFPFEDFLERLFENEGYSVKKRTQIQGKCALHEIDIAGYKDDHSFVAEAKFHMRPGIKSDLQVVLYSYARLLDLRSRPICKEDTCGIHDLFVITNTKFTNSAVKYAKCTGIKLLSWDYPLKNSLHERIEGSGLYPITVLTTLSNKHKQYLLETGVILCSELTKNPKMLKELNLSSQKENAVLDEVSKLCGSK